MDHGTPAVQRDIYQTRGFAFLLGLLGMLYLAIIWLDPNHEPIGTRPLLFYSGAILSVGVQLLSLGILAELVTAYNIRPEDTYSVVEKIPSRLDSASVEEPGTDSGPAR
jgi:hypothetical protein